MGRTWTRRAFADLYLWSVILLGTVAMALFRPEWTRQPTELVTLICLFALAEYFPTRVRVGAISFSFPIAFAAYMLYGIPGAAWTVTIGTAVANIARKRSWRVTWFNSAQFALATLATGHLTDLLVGRPAMGHLMVPLLTYLPLYYLTNNIIVDGLLWLRMKQYRFADWWTKTRYEGLSALISLGYSLLMIILTPQQRGHDPLALIFFFIPLLTVGTFVRLLAHMAQFASTLATLTEVSTIVTFSPERTVLDQALGHLDRIDDYRFAAIYQVEGEELAVRAVRGLAMEEFVPRRIPLGEGLSGLAAKQGAVLVAGDARQDGRNTHAEGSGAQVQALAAFPLASGGQVIGVLTLGKERSHSIQPEDVRLLTIFANLVAAILRNQDLAQEREQMLLMQERNRLAREIHDGLAQSLAGVLLQVDRLDRMMEQDSRGAHRLLGQLREHVRDILLEARRSIYNLRPSPLEESGLGETLRREVARLKEKGLDGNAELRVEVRGEQRRISTLVEDELFRIAQEGLTNALKHSGASEVTVSLQFQAESLRLMVRDNGCGFRLADAIRQARERHSFGLVGMSERAERLSASFEVDSRPGAGTKLTVDVPLLRQSEGG